MQQDRAHLAHGAARPRSSHARCSRTDLVPLTVLQHRARLALGASGQADGCQFWPAYWVSMMGLSRGCERWDLSSRLFGWCSGGSRVRRCQGLRRRGDGPGGGSAVLLGRVRGLVLPGGHGRVGGVVAGVWHWVAVSVGRGKSCSFYRRTGGGKARSLLKASSRLSLPIMRLQWKL